MPSVADLLPLPSPAEVGRRVRLARSVRELSQEAVVRRLALYGLELHQTAFSHVERGTRALKFVEAIALSRVLDVPLRWLGGEGVATDPGEPPAQTAALAALDELLADEKRRAAERER